MELDIVVETPMGSHNKYEMDHGAGRIRLDRTLFTATQYPADYGFVPETLAEDDEPLDALVLVAERTFPGCQIAARVVGVFWMRDQSGPDAKLLCVPARDPRQEHVASLADLPGHLVDEIGHFFAVYKEIEPGKCTEVRGWQDRESAEQVVRDAFARFGRR
ncbi:inorganic diphosphatase [Saccharopolyspora rosea]|uniref:Inorganic pyrophosphatase n=1 Tax=Saccharopolyspora rosea TaxID=524884 RepID=A0ABW3FTE4_9PSEU|nr:inorganic diphosphatase [Saccharopolyspora rosea]